MTGEGDKLQTQRKSRQGGGSNTGTRTRGEARIRGGDHP